MSNDSGENPSRIVFLDVDPPDVAEPADVVELPSEPFESLELQADRRLDARIAMTPSATLTGR